MRKSHTILLVSLAVGIVNALLFWLFEQAVDRGTNGIWNDLFKSNTHRWVVLPLAVSLGLLFSLIVWLCRQKRFTQPETHFMKPAGEASAASLRTIGVIILIGLMSLIAGASLGPEASLTAASAAIGAYAAKRARLGQTTKLLVMASVGALLVAFFGSLLLVFVPVFLLYRQHKKFVLAEVLPLLVAGVSAYIVLRLIKLHSHTIGYGTVPAMPHANWRDGLLAVVLGFVAVLVGYLLQLCIKWCAPLIQRFATRSNMLLMAAAVGLILGVIYWLGGQSIEFSGGSGSQLLLQGSAHYSAIALVGLLLAKLVATGWSLASGYRGGLIFPSIYMGVALGLVAMTLVGAGSGAGAMIGSVSGLVSVVAGSPLVAAVLVAALVPVKVIWLAVVAAIGTAAGTKLVKRLAPAKAD